MSKSKLFVIGFHRTGTRSVSAALQQLGYNIIHYPNPNTNELTCEEFKIGPPWNIINQCDGLSDIVTIPYYKKLSKIYKDSKFILTIREPTSWLNSVNRHMNALKLRQFNQERIMFDEMVHKAVYKVNNPTNSQKLAAFHNHNSSVINQFDNERLLIFNILEGWGPICEFLNVDIPISKFPMIK